MILDSLLCNMNDLELLQAQTRHVYEWLTSATQDVDDQSARFTLGGRPSIAWLTGHMLVNADSTVSAVTGLKRQVEERGSLVNWGCTESGDWSELRQQWNSHSKRYLAAFGSLTPSDLDATPLVEILPDFRDRLTDRRRFWSGHVFHMSYHLGQLGSLRAELELGWWTS